MHFNGDLAYYVAAFLSISIFGLSKGGLSALGALGIPVLALAVSPVKAAAITLPVLIVQDWVGVWAFRHDFDRRNLLILMPASLIGVGAGWGLASFVSEAAVRLVVGLISLGFVAFMLLRDRLAAAEPTRADVAPGIFWGAVSGFTSFVSHAGAAGFLVYTMPQRLPPRVFAGTSVLFFAAVNLLKIPPYILLGQFSRDNLFQSLLLLPVGILSTLGGVWLTRVIPMEKFYRIVLVLTFVVGIKLVYDALAQWL
jgi:uncharacterized membrane protein YfcA